MGGRRLIHCLVKAVGKELGRNIVLAGEEEGRNVIEDSMAVGWRERRTAMLSGRDDSRVRKEIRIFDFMYNGSCRVESGSFSGFWVNLNLT
ncbi:hypothetical protein MA16_Dca001660 [Dendrobium catenatum]|uniref:Uncharacterized protein n=1 Tax=Dendrobium catenatum TaxID=906689 RepID=A0A2I0WN16_9ASPA|nr:hypothetical protein MA16_Dca001660 [Dendrobium catenatum]